MLTLILSCTATAVVTAISTGLFTAWSYKKDQPASRPSIIPVLAGGWYKLPGIEDAALCRGYKDDDHSQVRYDFKLPDGLKIGGSEWVQATMNINDWEELATVWEKR